MGESCMGSWVLAGVQGAALAWGICGARSKAPHLPPALHQPPEGGVPTLPWGGIQWSGFSSGSSHCWCPAGNRHTSATSQGSRSWTVGKAFCRQRCRDAHLRGTWHAGFHGAQHVGAGL